MVQAEPLSYSCPPSSRRNQKLLVNYGFLGQGTTSETTTLHSVEELKAGYKDPWAKIQNEFFHLYIVSVTHSVTMKKKERKKEKKRNYQKIITEKWSCYSSKPSSVLHRALPFVGCPKEECEAEVQRSHTVFQSETMGDSEGELGKNQTQQKCRLERLYSGCIRREQ